MTVNLKQSNKLLKDLEKNFRNISPITSKDSILFKTIFTKEDSTYGNSWTYIIQGMYGIGPEGIGYKYYDGENLISLCFYPKLEDPDTLAFFMVRPCGPNVNKILKELGVFVNKKYGTPVYAKKIFKSQFDYLRKNGFKAVGENPWHSTAPAEDDTFPEKIVDIEYTLKVSADLGRTRQLNRSLRNFKKIEIEKSYDFKSAFENIEDAQLLIKKFFKQRNYLISRPEDYHNIIHKKFENVAYMESLVYEDGKAIGLFFCEVQSSDTASLYATITDRVNNNYLTDYLMFYLFDLLHKRGLKYLNLGGSEFKSLNDFKMKFRPCDERQMYWAVLY